MKLEFPLIGDRLLLRTLTEVDATRRYLAWLSDPDVIRHLEIRFAPPETLDDLSRFISDTNDSDDSIILGIFLRNVDQHIGNIKLGPINRHHSTADIGLVIGERSEWGKGHASMAIGLLTDYAFATFGLAKITAGCYCDNEGSRRAFLKAGFTEEGRRKAQYTVDGRRQDGILLGMVNPELEWENS